MTTEHRPARKRTFVVKGGEPALRVRLGSLAVAAVLTPLTGCGLLSPASPSASPSAAPSAAPSAPGSAPRGQTAAVSPAASPTSSSPKPSPSGQHSSKSPTGHSGNLSCTKLAGQLGLDQQIGQLFMVATDSSGMTDQQASQLSSLRVGSVLLLGDSTAGMSTAQAVDSAITQRVDSQQGVQVLIATDQEGGQVQRLAGPGFDEIPSAKEQSSMSDGELKSAAKGWAGQLKDAGVDADLAPDSDVVPTSMESVNEPIGQLDRGYGPKPAVVGRKDAAFIKGMEQAGVATSVKHFPGLGLVRGNTDTAANVHDDVTTRDDKRLAGFEAGAQAGADMVMISSAVYDKIDPEHPATFSSTVIKGMVRGDLGFQGVIISDDLMGKALSKVAVRQRALRFIRSGGDLAIVGQPNEAGPMIEAVTEAAASDPELKHQIRTAAGKVLIMKSRHGLADCST